MIEYTVAYSSLFERNLKRLKRKHFPVQCVIDSLDGIAKHDQVIMHKVKFHQLKNHNPVTFECHPFRMDSKYSRMLDDYVMSLIIDHDEIMVVAINIGTHDILK
ncbi:hypothetical protein ACYATO_08670 [Lactobacillaceae bacterium Melli_B3]